MQDKGHHQLTQSFNSSGKSSSSRSLLKHLQKILFLRWISPSVSIMMFIFFCSFIAHKSISNATFWNGFNLINDLFYRAKEKSWKLKLNCVRCGKYSKDLCRFQSIILQSLNDLLSVIYHHSTKISDEIVECFLLSFAIKKIVSRLVFTKGIRARKNEFIKKTFSFFYVNIPPLPNCRWFFHSILFSCLSCLYLQFLLLRLVFNTCMYVYAGYALYSLLFGWLLTFFIIYWTL